MKVLELLQSRRDSWAELQRECAQLEGRRLSKMPGRSVARFAALYRSACADLALADAYHLPSGTIEFLHRLVGRAHNQLYRSRGFRWRVWLNEILYTVPQRLFHDNSLRLAFVVFWGVFAAAMLTAYLSPASAENILGREQIENFEEMYAKPIGDRTDDASGFMAGFYVWNNAGIGLQCFAAGLVFGVLGLFTTISNAAILGTTFGYMMTVSQRDNFYTFVTAHGPFELTAIVLAAGAGMRLGFSLIDTRGWTRGAALRLAAREAVPAISVSVLLFILAAGIEAFVSPSSLPYWVKAGIAVLSCSMLTFYIVGLGYEREVPRAA